MKTKVRRFWQKDEQPLAVEIEHYQNDETQIKYIGVVKGMNREIRVLKGFFDLFPL